MGDTKFCNQLKKTRLILTIVISCGIILGSIIGTFNFVDSRYAYASRVSRLELEFKEKKLRDEIFQIKMMIAQENILNSGQNSQTLLWLKNQLGIKESKLKILLRED